VKPARTPRLSADDEERAARRARRAKNKAFLLKVLLTIAVMAGVWAWIFWRVLNQRYPLPPGALSNAPEPVPEAAPASSASPPTFKLLVTAQQDGIQITNETNVTWDQCQVEISGGYSADLAILPAQFTDRIVFADFKRDGRSMPTSEGYGRGKQRVEISCIGPDSKRYTATF
jgi:hypothetical protein